jgi:hypothetical protein
MNKLRELITKVDDKSIPGTDYLALLKYLDSNAEAIADLIDAAKSTGLSLRADHPLSVALSKLEK